MKKTTTERPSLAVLVDILNNHVIDHDMGSDLTVDEMDAALRLTGLCIVPDRKPKLWPYRPLRNVKSAFWRRTLLVLGLLPITTCWLIQILLLGLMWTGWQLAFTLYIAPGSAVRCWRGEETPNE